MALYRPTTITTPAGTSVENQAAILDASDATMGDIFAPDGDGVVRWVGVSAWSGAVPVGASLRIRALRWMEGSIPQASRQPEVYVGGALTRTIATWESSTSNDTWWSITGLGTVAPAQVALWFPVVTAPGGTSFLRWWLYDIALDYTPTETLLSASGARTLAGIAALSVPVLLSATGAKTGAATAALLAPSRLAAVGARTLEGSALLSSSAGLSAAGARTITGTAALLAPSRLSAVGARSLAGEAGLCAPSRLAAVGARMVTGTAALAIGGFVYPNPTLQGRRIARDLQIPYQGDPVS